MLNLGIALLKEQGLQFKWATQATLKKSNTGGKIH